LCRAVNRPSVNGASDLFQVVYIVPRGLPDISVHAQVFMVLTKHSPELADVSDEQPIVASL
jgi:hypothetical protein